MDATTVTRMADRISHAMLTATTRQELVTPLIEVMDIEDQCLRETVMVGIAVVFVGKCRNDMIAFLMSVLCNPHHRDGIRRSILN